MLKSTVPVKDDHVTKFRWITSVISVKCSQILKDLEYFSAISLFSTVFQDFKFIFKYGGFASVRTELSFTNDHELMLAVGYFCE